MSENEEHLLGMTPHEAVYRLRECECYSAELRCYGCQVAVNVISQLFSTEEAEKIGVIEEFVPAQLLPSDETLPNDATYEASLRWEKADVRYKAGKDWTLVPVKRGEPGFDQAPFLLPDP
jgi:hypothetical protein